MNDNGDGPSAKEQAAEELRIALAYIEWADSDIGRDLLELMNHAVAEAEKTLYESLSQDPRVAFGLMKRWQERGAMRDAVVRHIQYFRDLAEQLRAELLDRS